ncbi:unnamed protein product [Rotaria sp. Silwood1]|nr:unnamed protein product [Rotaria sp. Silwood1]CAF3487790.1 unnamed protein product [Rotaria sp. Silwood1]CAF4846551.1 unnamed protein product [Rotaria sp. Silwood1]
MSLLRVKVQLGDEASNNQRHNSIPILKFVYVIESPTNKTINELIQLLQKYINEQFYNNIQIVQLTTNDGFILSKSDICSTVLKDNEHIICIDLQTFTNENYSTIDFDHLWFELKQHDASDNEEKCIQIGLNCFSKLFIRMFGTLNMNGIYIFSVYELIKITNEKRKDNLIARLDNTNDNDQTVSMNWFLETKWEYDKISNKDLFIICNLKTASDDQVLSEKLHILLDHSRMRIQKGEITHLSGEKNDSTGLTDQQRQRLKELASKLPPPKQTGPHIALSEIQNLKLTKNECEGESSIRMACGNTNTVNAYQDIHATENNTVRQHFTITHIIFSKKPTVLPEILQQKRSIPVEKPVSVANLTVFYQIHDGSWRECQDIAIAPIAIRNEEPKWLTDSIINIEPDKLFSFIIKGCIRIKGEPGRDNQSRARIHKSLPQPFKLKIVINDNFGKQCSLVVEQLNKPLDLITRESYLKSNQSSIKELLAFVYADDCENDGRIFMAIYLDKENELVIKNPGAFSNIFGRKVLRTMEFEARQNKTTELHLDRMHYQYCGLEAKAFAIFDPETYMLYAFRLELSTTTSTTEETVLIPLEKIQ